MNSFGVPLRMRVWPLVSGALAVWIYLLEAVSGAPWKAMHHSEWMSDSLMDRLGS